jgi:hypothetical protein
MPGALAALAHVPGHRAVEEHHRFRRQRTALVAPNDNTSTPAFQVASAGLAFIRTSALAKRAPSMWTFMPWPCAILASAAISSDR